MLFTKYAMWGEKSGRQDYEFFQKDLLNNRSFYNVPVEMCSKKLDCLRIYWGYGNTYSLTCIWVRVSAKREWYSRRLRFKVSRAAGCENGIQEITTFKWYAEETLMGKT